MNKHAKILNQILGEARFQGHSPERRLMEVIATAERGLRQIEPNGLASEVCKLYGHAPNTGLPSLVELLSDSRTE